MRRACGTHTLYSKFDVQVHTPSLPLGARVFVFSFIFHEVHEIIFFFFFFPSPLLFPLHLHHAGSFCRLRPAFHSPCPCAGITDSRAVKEHSILPPSGLVDSFVSFARVSPSCLFSFCSLVSSPPPSSCRSLSVTASCTFSLSFLCSASFDPNALSSEYFFFLPPFCFFRSFVSFLSRWPSVLVSCLLLLLCYSIPYLCPSDP